MYTRGLSVGLVVLIIGISFLSLANGFASAGSQAQMSIGFESGWDSSWSANDYNSASGLDYWGISTYRSHSGSHSAYCAEIGTNSVNSIANNVNHYYDQDMQAWFEIPIGDISAWSSATLSFYAWYVTGSFSLADYLRVDNSSNGVNFYIQWTQTALSSSGWEFVSFSLSTSTTSLAFIFESDPTVGWGPYEGVYIDDIVVTVTDSQIPSSSVGSLSSFQTTSSFSIPYTASDSGGSGLAYVELYYRLGTSGAFTLYTTATNPSGHWTSSPIEFDSSITAGDGTYQFYTRAVDSIGNQEAAPAAPDATTTVDTVAPSTAQDLTGTLGSSGWYKSSVLVTLVSSDMTSGIAATIYRIDSGSWQTYSSSFLLSSEGIHALDFYSTDDAGNSEIEKSVSVKIDTVPPDLAITTPLNGTYMKGESDISWSCSDSNGIVKSEVKFDAWGWQDVTGTTCHASLADGNHTVQVRVTDPAGNQATRLATFLADSTLPEVVIAAPLEGSFTSSNIMHWWVSDNTGIVVPYEVNIDYGGWMFIEGGLAWVLDVPDGPHTFQTRATDYAGNIATRTVNFTLDTTDPLLQISGPVDGSTIRGNYVTVTWKYSDNIGIKDMRMTIDGVGGDIVENGQLTDLKLANGHHTIEITVTDLAGNQVTKRVTFTMDSQALSFSGPYYGIPLVAIIAAIILVALFVVLKYVRKPKIAAPPETPKDMQ